MHIEILDNLEELTSLRVMQQYELHKPKNVGDVREFRYQVQNYLRCYGDDSLHAFVKKNENTGTIVATCYLQVNNRMPHIDDKPNREGYICSVYTDPDWRGKGICEELITEALAFSKFCGCRKMGIDTVNPAILKLCERQDFKPSEKSFIRSVD